MSIMIILLLKWLLLIEKLSFWLYIIYLKILLCLVTNILSFWIYKLINFAELKKPKKI